jgi:hypothetical protein
MDYSTLGCQAEAKSQIRLLIQSKSSEMNVLKLYYIEVSDQRNVHLCERINEVMETVYLQHYSRLLKESILGWF